MSLRPDGTYRCDRCGTDIENAGPDRAVTLSGADPFNPTLQRVLHLCIDFVTESGRTVQGCRDRVMSKRALANYHENRK